MNRLVRLAHLGEDEHGGHLRDEENAADREEDPEAVTGKAGPRTRDDERDDEREHDEDGGDDEEPRLVAGQRQQHEPDATTVPDGRDFATARAAPWSARSP